MKWYKKVTDATAGYIAKQCGITDLVAMVSPVIHEDDLEGLRKDLFKVSPDTMSQLFEETVLPE